MLTTVTETTTTETPYACVVGHDNSADDDNAHDDGDDETTVTRCRAGGRGLGLPVVVGAAAAPPARCKGSATHGGARGTSGP